jgi:probable rRNA maturation factor
MKKVLKDLACDAKELSILFTDDERIAELNKKYRGKDKSTNVLAFPMAGGDADIESAMLGDVVISVDTAEREAAGTGETMYQAVFRLLIHGLLHLIGYDHERSKRDQRIMSEEEARVGMLIKEDINGASGCKY